MKLHYVRWSAILLYNTSLPSHIVRIRQQQVYSIHVHPLPTLCNRPPMRTLTIKQNIMNFTSCLGTKTRFPWIYLQDPPRQQLWISIGLIRSKPVFPGFFFFCFRFGSSWWMPTSPDIHGSVPDSDCGGFLLRPLPAADCIPIGWDIAVNTPEMGAGPSCVLVRWTTSCGWVYSRAVLVCYF